MSHFAARRSFARPSYLHGHRCVDYAESIQRVPPSGAACQGQRLRSVHLTFISVDFRFFFLTSICAIYLSSKLADSLRKTIYQSTIDRLFMHKLALLND